MLRYSILIVSAVLAITTAASAQVTFQIGGGGWGVHNQCPPPRYRQVPVQDYVYVDNGGYYNNHRRNRWGRRRRRYRNARRAYRNQCPPPPRCRQRRYW